MNKNSTGLAASGLSHPDYGDTVGERIRFQAAMTASLLAFISLACDNDRPEQLRLLWDVLSVAAERAIALTEALDGVEITLPPGQRPLSPAPAKGERPHE